MRSDNTARIRQSNLECLRIIAAIGVVVLHYNHATIGGAFSVVRTSGKTAFMLYMLEALFVGCVDLFMMIFGHFQAARNNAKVSKVVLLLMQVSFVRAAYYLLVETAAGKGQLTALGLFKSFLPSNYFVITYCVIYLLSPYINRLMNDLTLAGKKKLVFLLLFLFSFCPLVLALLHSFLGVGVGGLSTVSTNGDGEGYTVVNYFLMYCIGAISKDIKMSRQKCAVGFACCYLPLFLMELCLHRLGLFKGNVHSYFNPLVVGCAFFSLMFFSSVEIKPSPFINRIAGGSFMVFLTHKYFFPLFSIKEYVSRGGWIVLVHLAAVCLCSYIIGWLLSEVYSFISRPLSAVISRRFGKLDIEV